MVMSYDYGKHKKGRQKTNATPLWAILMAMQACWSNTDGITQCGMSRATPEATDAAIGQLIAPYHPGGREGNSKQNDDKKWTNIAGYFDGHDGAPVRYRAHHPMEEVQGFGRSHWTPPSGKYCGR